MSAPTLDPTAQSSFPVSSSGVYAPSGSTATTTAPKSHAECALFTWKDPVKTGKVFGALIVSLVVLKSVNLVSLFFRLGALALITSAVAEYAGKLVTGTGFITRFRPAYNSTFSTKTSQALQSLAKDLPTFEEEGQRLLYSFDIEKTLKAAGLFYVLYKITSWLSLYKLIFISTVLAFTVPAIYENYEKEINEIAAKLSHATRQKAKEYSAVAQEKAAPYLKRADEKLGPVSKFIKEKYQVRTAGSTVAQGHPESFATATTTGSTTSTAPFTTSASQIKTSVPATSGSTHIANPFESTASTAFPSAPTTQPFGEKLRQEAGNLKTQAQAETVDVDDFKKDLTKNKLSGY